MYSVYRHTSPTGKVYIGITKQKPENRWQRGFGYRTQKRFYRAILKYGWDNFTHEVLYTGLNFEDAEQKERELILEYRSFDKNFGYNLERGGNCCKEVSEATREKMRLSHTTEQYRAWMQEKNTRRWSDPAAHEKMSEMFKGDRNPMHGKKLTEEHKKKLLEASRAVPHRVLRGEENPMYGKTLSDEAKAKIGIANSGGKNGKARCVICADTGEIFDCIRDASRKTGIHHDSISRCCRRITHTAGGLRWKYADSEEAIHP